MKKIVLCFILITFHLLGNMRFYQGTIGNSKVEFQVEYDFEFKEAISIIYMYSSYGVPIILEKKDKNIFYEHDNLHNNTSIIEFEDDNFTKGIMKNLKTGKTYAINLKKVEDFKNESFYSDVEIFQKYSTEKFFFKVVIKKESDNHHYVDGIDIYDIDTGKKIQHINLRSSRKVNVYKNDVMVGTKDYYEGNGIFGGFVTIQVGDFNYDGIQDFSLMIRDDVEETKFGTTYIFDKKKELFIDAGIMGNYVEFDKKNKTAAGKSEFEGETFVNCYKLENDKYIFVEEYSEIYDSINEEVIKVKSGKYPEPTCNAYVPQLYLYEGHIGDARINLQFHSGINTKAIYTYDKYKIPIVMEAKEVENEVVFYEYDFSNKERAEIKFNKNFNYGIEEISGTFTNLKTNKVSLINLKLVKKYIEKIDYDKVEIYQSASSKDVFFTIEGHYSSGYEYPSFSVLNAYSKKTGEELIFNGIKLYTLDLEPRLMIFDNIKIIGDHNIDGIPDFTVQTSLSDYTKVEEEKSIYSRIFIENKGKTIRYVEYKKEEDGTFTKLSEKSRDYDENKGEY